MKIGFAAPVSGSWATPDNLAFVARRADELGYHSLWTFQRLLSPADGGWGEVYRSVLDPLLPLAYAAAVTSRVRLGVAVVNLPFVAPPVLAKQLATLDILSGGRVDAGLGNGWSDEEFAATGADKRRQGARADEYLALLRRLWTEPVIDHRGGHYRVPSMRLDPKPVQRPHPPLLLGAGAPAALRRAGRLCDGWVSSSRADPRTLGRSVAVVKEAAERAGRDPEALRFVCRGVVRLRPAGGPGRLPLSGTVDQVRADIDQLAGQGITETFIDLNFDPEIGSPDADPAAARRRAGEVLEAFAPAGPPETPEAARKRDTVPE
jgi:probable F420-dependent oxidoreductase